MVPEIFEAEKENYIAWRKYLYIYRSWLPESAIEVKSKKWKTFPVQGRVFLAYKIIQTF